MKKINDTTQMTIEDIMDEFDFGKCFEVAYDQARINHYPLPTRIRDFKNEAETLLIEVAEELTSLKNDTHMIKQSGKFLVFGWWNSEDEKVYLKLCYVLESWDNMG